MSINDKTGELSSINTEGRRALNLFTDRHQFIRLFADYLNEDPPPNKILFFDGDGGNGKSLLLKFLREKCCKRFRWKIWQRLRTQSDEKVAAYIKSAENPKAKDFDRVPAVVHDFGQRPNGDDKPQDSFYGLLMLQRQLAREATKLGYRLRFPLYDYACVWYLHQKNRLSLERLQELFPEEEIDFLIEVADVVSGAMKIIPLGVVSKAAFNIFSKHRGKHVLLYLQGRGLKEDEV